MTPASFLRPCPWKSLLSLVLLILSLLGALAPARLLAEGKIAGVFVDVARIHHDAKSNGDTWDYLWADNGAVYSFACDSRGYGTAPRNLNFNRLDGSAWDQLTGNLVNAMDEYGSGGAYLADGAAFMVARTNWGKIPRGPNWKVSGAECIDGVFYAFVAENWYGNQNAYGGKKMDSALRQTVRNMSLIKSTDRGITWTRTMVANAREPMWTNQLFSTGFFFKYGQNGGHTTQDDQNEFIYAMSNDGYWDSGSHFTLGRVARNKIADLNAADWQYYSNGAWTNRLSAASRIPGLPDGTNLCTMGSPIWLPSLQTYVAPLWHDVGKMFGWYFPPDVRFDFWQAPHPWGPWSRIGGLAAMDFIGDPGPSRAHRWYGPTFSPKFITENPDGSVTAILLFSGSTWEDKPDSLYKNNSCPVTFYPQPLPKLRETVNDTAASYSPGWSYQTNRNVGDWHNDVHVTTQADSYCEYCFQGVGIEVLSEKFHDLGNVEVLVDGESQGVFSLYQDPMPRLYQIPFYRKMDLPPGRHTVRIVNRATNGSFCLIDGFRIYDR